MQARFDPLSPFFLRVLRQIVNAGVTAKKPVTLCGELAGRPLSAMALAGIGFRNLSMAPAAIGPVKAMVRSLNVGDFSAYLGEHMERGDSRHSLREAISTYAKSHDVPV
jgi:phosphotransferase system enzyme I (PtsP)